MWRALSQKELQQIKKERELIIKAATVFFVLFMIFPIPFAIGNVLDLVEKINVKSMVLLIVDGGIMFAVWTGFQYLKKAMYGDLENLRACDVIIQQMERCTYDARDNFSFSPSTHRNSAFQIIVQDEERVEYEVRAETSFGERHAIWDKVVLVKDMGDETEQTMFLIESDEKW